MPHSIPSTILRRRRRQSADPTDAAEAAEVLRRVLLLQPGVRPTDDCRWAEFGGDFYELLGIRQDGSFDEIKQAYKKKALKYHPDVSPPNCTEQYTQHFIRLKKAYETLSDPVTRVIYDRHLAGGLHFNEKMEEQSRWRANWEDQLEELQGRSMKKQSENQSWGAQMRKKRDSSTD